MQTKKSFRKHKIVLTIIFAVTALCLLIIATSALSNFWAPSCSQVVEHLDELQKARIAETLHLRRNLGDQIWSVFGQFEALGYIPGVEVADAITGAISVNF